MSVNRKLLDFDFEKICSVSLSPLNCYACLTCRKYFQGRSEGTPAYMHALHHSHLLYLNMKTLKAYTLPDDQEFNDSGQLDDIRAVIKPKFTRQLLQQIDENTRPLTDLLGRPFLPGFIGLNQIKANDYVNVILQALSHIRPLRDYFILGVVKPGLGEVFKEVLEKIWNPTKFKAQTSPHEFLQTISTISSKRFSLVKQSDPLDFLVFLLNNLSKDYSIMNELLQGRIKIDSCDISMVKNQENRIPEMKSDLKPFFFLTLDLPPKPLFADPRNPTAIPQINLSVLLEKFNGGNLTYKQNTAYAYSIQKYPKYLILHLNRFVKNNFVVEHNPTIVQFSPNSLSLPVDQNEMSDGPVYNLLANIYCTFPNDENKNEKSFGVQLKCPATGQWLDIENLSVKETQAQMLFMSESYIQIWELQ